MFPPHWPSSSEAAEDCPESFEDLWMILIEIFSIRRLLMSFET